MNWLYEILFFWCKWYQRLLRLGDR